MCPGVEQCYICGVVLIVSANEAEDRGFESRQGVRLKEFMHRIVVLCNLSPIGIVCVYELDKRI
jgi:hypothetical protein